MRYTPPPGSTAPDAPYVTGVPGLLRGSPVPAEAVENPQREIVKVIQEAGLEPSNEDLTQLWQAIGLMITGAGPLQQYNSEQWITESGTFTAPVGGWYSLLLLAGGSSGMVNTNTCQIASGASGAIKSALMYLEKGQEVPVVIGAGGVPAGPNTGSAAGGDTSFGDVSTAGEQSYFVRHPSPDLSNKTYWTTIRVYAPGLGGGDDGSDAVGHFGGGGSARYSPNRSDDSAIRIGKGAPGSILARWHDPAKANGPLPQPALLSARRMAPRVAAAPVTVNLYDPETGQGSVWREEDAPAQLARGLITQEAWMEICEAKAAEARALWLVSPDTEAERYDLLRATRDARLAATDYLTAADYPLADDQRAEVTAYRQALRDLPAEEGAPWDGGGEATPWPDAPTVVASKAVKADAVVTAPAEEEAPAVETVPEIPAVETPAPESPAESQEEA